MEDRVIDLYHQYGNMHKVARELGIPIPKVQAALRRNGVEVPERTQGRNASMSYHARMEARYEQLNETLLTNAERMLKDQYSPAKMYAFSAKDGMFYEHDIDTPTIQDQTRMFAGVNQAISAMNGLKTLIGGSNTQTINLILATAEKLGLDDGE